MSLACCNTTRMLVKTPANVAYKAHVYYGAIEAERVDEIYQLDHLHIHVTNVPMYPEIGWQVRLLKRHWVVRAAQFIDGEGAMELVSARISCPELMHVYHAPGYQGCFEPVVPLLISRKVPSHWTSATGRTGFTDDQGAIWQQRYRVYVECDEQVKGINEDWLFWRGGEWFQVLEVGDAEIPTKLPWALVERLTDASFLRATPTTFPQT